MQMGTVLVDRRALKPRFVLRYRDVSGAWRRETTTTSSRQLARRLLSVRNDQVLQARLAGLPSVEALINPQAPMTVRQFVEGEFLRHVRANDSAKTIHRYAGIWKNHLKAAFGTMTLTELKPSDLQRYADRRRTEGASAATVCHELCFMSALYREAVKAELVDRNPVHKVKKPVRENTVVRFLSHEEEANLLAFAPEWLRAPIVISIHSGLREGELRRLTWSDVSFERGTITARHTKSKRDRVIPMNETLRATLAAIPRRLDTNLVVTGAISGKGIAQLGAKAWRRTLKRAGIERFRWHDLRHTFASRLAQAGVPILAIQKLLGHGSLVMTMRYAHLQEKNLREAVGSLDTSNPRKIVAGR